MILLSADASNKMLNALRDLLDSGSEPAYLIIYSGDVPAGIDGPAAGATALVTLPLSKPSAGDATARRLNFNAIPSGGTTTPNATAGGTASFFRIGVGQSAILQGTVTDASGNGDMKLQSTAVTQGQPVQITSAFLAVV